jgi:hypothetical protein
MLNRNQIVTSLFTYCNHTVVDLRQKENDRNKEYRFLLR